MKIVIIGDSHTQALKKALSSNLRQELKDAIEIHTFAKVKNGKKVGDLTIEELILLVSTLTEQDILFSLIGGNQHNSVSLIQHPETFNVIMPKVSNSDNATTTLIPYQVMKSVFDKGLRGNDFKRLAQLKQATQAKVWHLATVPPKYDSEHILKKHEVDFASKGIVSNGVSDPLLRLKMWYIQAEVTQSLCDELEISYMEFPKEAQDEAGFLATHYYADDATHANEFFGDLMINKIFQSFSEKGN